MNIGDRVTTAHGMGTVVALESFPEYGADGPRYGIELDANPFSYSPAYFWPRELAQVFDYPEASA